MGRLKPRSGTTVVTGRLFHSLDSGRDRSRGDTGGLTTEELQDLLQAGVSVDS